ncbi:hypothetical protein D3C71_1368350 [compost metagenome]
MIATHAPGPKVQAAVQIQVLVAGVPGAGTSPLEGRSLVADKRGIDAVVPQLGVDMTKHIPAHGNLRYGDRELQLTGVEIGRGAGNQRSNIDTDRWSGVRFGKAVELDPHLLEQFVRQAGNEFAGVGRGEEFDFALIEKHLIDVNAHQIPPRAQILAFGQGIQGQGTGIAGVAVELAHEGGLELGRCTGVCRIGLQ